jgi:hypothetical protein
LNLPAYYKDLLGKPIDVQKASEPTDIIWENRMYTPFQRFIKKIVVFIICSIALLISGIIIYYLSKRKFDLKSEYP